MKAANAMSVVRRRVDFQEAVDELIVKARRGEQDRLQVEFLLDADSGAGEEGP